MQGRKYLVFFDGQDKLVSHYSRAIPEQTHGKYQDMLQGVGLFLYSFSVMSQHSAWKIRKTLADIRALNAHLKEAGYSCLLPVASEQEQPAQLLAELLQITLDLVLQKCELSEEVRQFYELPRDQPGQQVLASRILKYTGGRQSDSYFTSLITKLGSPYPIFLVVSREGLAWSNSASSKTKEFMFFDQHFYYRCGNQLSASNPLAILVHSSQRELWLQAEHPGQYFAVVAALKEACLNNQLLCRNRYCSFAPIREDGYCKFLVDGEEYFCELLNCLMQAKQEVLLAGWCLSPYLYLKRPASREVNADYRLDNLLRQIAERGVKVKVIVYNESSYIANDSEFCKSYLESLSENITVLRHPAGKLQLLWTRHEKVVVVDGETAFLGGVDLTFSRYDTPQHRLFEPEESVLRGSFLFPFHDYSNLYQQEVTQCREQEACPFPRDSPRMPWHDVAVRLQGGSVDDVVRSYIQSWNFICFQLSLGGIMIHSRLQSHELTSKRFSQRSNCRTQVVRSAGTWSAGLSEDHKQSSIYCAYVNLITMARHSIYIQNQFFITSTAGEEVKNLIGFTLANKIIQSFKERRKFRVVLVLPLLPAFPGDFAKGTATLTMATLYWLYHSLCRGDSSLLEQLKEVSDLHERLLLVSLRKYERGQSQPIYVHSKLMIVDDRVAIIGSANINDRSMDGGKDSQMAVVVEDPSAEEGLGLGIAEKGHGLQADGAVHRLRVRLWQEHFAMSEEEAWSMGSDTTWSLLRLQCAKNTHILRLLLQCIPDDHVRRISDIPKPKELDPEEQEHLENEIRGHGVEFPHLFLADEYLQPSLGAVEYLLPNAAFI